MSIWHFVLSIGDGQKELHNQNVLLPGVISQDLAALVAEETCNFGQQSLRVMMHKMNFEWADSRFDELLLTKMSESHEVYCSLPGEEVEVDEAHEASDDSFDMVAAARDRGKRQRRSFSPQPPSRGSSTAGLVDAASNHLELEEVMGEEADFSFDLEVVAHTVADHPDDDVDHPDDLGSDCDDIADDSESSSECEIFAPTTEAARCGLYYMGNPY